MSTDASESKSTSNRLERYWEQSRQPLASLVFIAPLLVTYETGVLLFGPARVRNGADAWLRQLLDLLGFGQYFLLPVLTVCILLGWHYLTRRPWRLSSTTVWAMAVECLALSICLRLVLQVLALLFPRWVEQTVAGLLPIGLENRLAAAVGFLGAGIYEELLFRLILLSLIAWAIRGLTAAKPRGAMIGAIAVSSLLFAAAHYLPPSGYPLTAFSFLFRLTAGVFFSVLFWYRGFGIAAGAHAGYDILVGVFPRL